MAVDCESVWRDRVFQLVELQVLGKFSRGGVCHEI